MSSQPRHGGVGHLEVLAQRVDRERRADALGQRQHEQLEAAEVGHALEARDLVAQEAGAVLARPPVRLHLRAAEERLRESSEGQEVGHGRLRVDAELRHRELVEPEEVVAALQRVAAEAVEIEAGAARDQDPLARAPPVVQTLEPVPPAAVLVDLVEHPELRDRQLAPQDALAVLGHVPVEVPGLGTGDAPGQGRLADLPRSGDEDHLPRQVRLDLGHEIPRGHGSRVEHFRPVSRTLATFFQTW